MSDKIGTHFFSGAPQDFALDGKRFLFSSFFLCRRMNRLIRIFVAASFVAVSDQVRSAYAKHSEHIFRIFTCSVDGSVFEQP